MSSLLERPLKSGRDKKAPPSILTGLPQVNLLPPEVRAARGLQSIKRWLVIALLVVVALCALVWLYAQSVAANAKSDLETAQAETVRLTQEQAKYAEVPKVKAQLADAERALAIGGATDVEWRQFFDAITAVLPDDVSIDTFGMTGATPMTAPELSTDPLQAPSVGQIAFGARSATVPDVAELVEALNSIPGFSDAFVTSVAVSEDEVSGAFYAIQATVQYSADTYSHRFDPADPAADAETDEGK